MPKKRQTKQREDPLLSLIAQDIHGAVIRFDAGSGIKLIYKALQEVQASAREKTIEECAKELEKYQLRVNGHQYSFAAVAEDIRSLSAKEKR